MKKVFLIAIIIVAVYASLTQPHQSPTSHREAPRTETSGDTSYDRIPNSGVNGNQLQGQGTVIKILPDDRDGSQHQKFILKLSSGKTLLVAHNIDIAPRIASLRVGDNVAFCGEYAENPRGGVIHWTHHDPSGHHPNGWLKHHNNTYQ
jgi:hypothetical protein